MSSRASGQRGFTLLEIMVSMALLVIGMLGIIAMHATAVKGNRMSRQLGRARVIAGQVMEDLRGKDLATLGTGGTFASVTTPEGMTYTPSYTLEGVSGAACTLITVTVDFVDNTDAPEHHTTKIQMMRTLVEKL